MNLDQLIETLRNEDPNLILPIGFNNPHSWRGDYYDLAFEPARNITVGAMLHAAEQAHGATFEGWKGGYFTMRGSTDCHLDTEGSSMGETIGPVLLRLMIDAGKAGLILPE